MKQWKLAYAGFDIKTFFVLVSDERFKLIAVAYNDALATIDVNPINWIGALLYRRIYKAGSSIPDVRVLYFLWRHLKFLSTGNYYKHRIFITTLYESNISILNLENNSAAVFLKNSADLLIVNVWGLLSKDVVFACTYGAFNIHPSHLPKYRGSQPTLWALKNGDTSSAVSYMLLDESMDTGKIVNQHLFQIDKNDDWRSLELKVEKIISSSLSDDISAYLSGTLSPHEQDKAQSSITARYSEYRKISLIKEKAVDIYNKVNLYPHLEHGVYCYFKIDRRKIYIKGCRYGKSLNDRKALELAFKANEGYIFCKLIQDVSLVNFILLLFTKRDSLIV